MQVKNNVQLRKTRYSPSKAGRTRQNPIKPRLINGSFIIISSRSFRSILLLLLRLFFLSSVSFWEISFPSWFFFVSFRALFLTWKPRGHLPKRFISRPFSFGTVLSLPLLLVFEKFNPATVPPKHFFSFHWFSPAFTGFYWVLHGFIGLQLCLWSDTWLSRFPF